MRQPSPTRRRANSTLPIRRSKWRLVSLFAFAIAPLVAPGGAIIAQEGTVNREAIEAVMAADPTTPDELIRTAETVRGLGDPALARELLGRVSAANLDRKGLSDLVSTFGSPRFVRMATDESLVPEGRDLANRALDAFRDEHQDPANLDRWVAELQDPSERVRFNALESLRRSQGAAVTPLVAVLVDPSRQDARDVALSALRRLELDARGPLVAMLESSDPKTVAAALDALGEVGSRRELIYLLSPYTAEASAPAVREAAGRALARLIGTTPDPATAAKLLAREAEHYFHQIVPLAHEVQQQSPDWTFDEATGQVTETWRDTDAVYRRRAARFAREASAVLPDNARLRRLYLTTLLDQAAYENGLDQPLLMAPGEPAAEAAEAGVADLVGVVEFAIEADHPAAAAAAVRILGEIGSPDELLYVGGDPSVLVRAANHSDRRLRYAAVEAVMRLAPENSYAGASRVLTTLFHLATASGRRVAVVAGPNGEEASRVAGHLIALGYQVETTSDGRTAMAAAASQADCQLILVDAMTQTPVIEILVQLLRAEPRTADIPVGILARADQLDRARRAASLDRLAIAFPRPHTAASVAWDVEQITGPLAERIVPADVRLRQAKQAMHWIVDLYKDDRQNIRQRWQDAERLAVRAMLLTELRPEAIELMRLLPTHTAQTTLVDFASRFGQPVADRRAAAEALFDNIEANGLLLTKKQVLEQYDRYNSSEHEDAASQAILGSILDWFEAGQ